jgi:hypothetical protein
MISLTLYSNKKVSIGCGEPALALPTRPLEDVPILPSHVGICFVSSARAPPVRIIYVAP